LVILSKLTQAGFDFAIIAAALGISPRTLYRLKGKLIAIETYLQ
jgi:hypothetical protein